MNAEEDRANADLEEAEALFRREILPDQVASWRSAQAPPSRFIVEQACAADLLVVTRHGKLDGDPGLLGCSIGALLMEIGRPVLVMPPNMDRVESEWIVIAWKNTREARRAVADALPLLKPADLVVVASVGSAADPDSAEAVATYLSHHGIKASVRVETSPFGSVTETLLSIVGAEDASVIVLGAYGHSRLR